MVDTSVLDLGIQHLLVGTLVVFVPFQPLSKEYMNETSALLTQIFIFLRPAGKVGKMQANKHICHASGIYREIPGNNGKYWQI